MESTSVFSHKASKAAVASSTKGKTIKNPLQLVAGPEEELPKQMKHNPLQLAAEEEEPMQAKQNPLQLAATPSANPFQLEQVPAKANNTGLPNNLKAGVENLSGHSMDDVKVHYNSAQPAQLHALAYAQGTDIHVAPGQEKHLPHEAWHVVQQKQGRVQPTMQMKEGVPVNNDAGLENEADVMGAKALQMMPAINPGLKSAENMPSHLPTIMRRVDPDFAGYRAATAAAGAITKLEIQTFYDKYVKNEVTRLTAAEYDDDLKETMKYANLRFTVFVLNSTEIPEITARLDELVVAVNNAANCHEAIVHKGGLVNEELFRNERQKREGSKTRAGITKEMDLRGVKSRAEAQLLLTKLQTDLNASLGDCALGHVGIRGSAVTGLRSRNQAPFEQGTGAHQNVSDASDLDFFFTSATLETKIKATEGILGDRGINEGGTLMAKYLKKWLTAGTAKNKYASGVALEAALSGFATYGTGLTGRKCDVTFVGGATAAGLMGNDGTLIL